MNALVTRLIATHRQLNREIRRELSHRLPDQLRLKMLKKHRLATKDQLFRHVPDAAEFRRAARRLLASLRAPSAIRRSTRALADQAGAATPDGTRNRTCGRLLEDGPVPG